MHPNALLDLSTELLRSVLKLDAPADGLVSQFFRKHRDLGARERHTLAETTYTVLRQRQLYLHLAQLGKFGGQTSPLERRLSILAWQGATTCPTGWPTRCATRWATSSGPWWMNSTSPRRWTCVSTP